MTLGGLLLIAGLALSIGLAVAHRSVRLWLIATLMATVAALGAAAWVLAGGGVWDWRSVLLIGGEPVHLRLDAVSAFFLALLAVLGGAGSAYAHEYWTDKSHPRSAPSGRAWWNALLGFMGLVLLSANGLHFLIAWELFAVSAYFLITRERHRREVRQAGWLYLAASHAGTLCLFAFFTLLAARTGTWDLGPLRDRAELAPLFWLALFGFGVKAGLFPLHIWLPSGHANAPSHVSAILSGAAIKMGIYGLVRFTGWLPVPDAAGWVVVALGVTSAVLGVAFALGQHDLKRLLAYHSVENIGIIAMGIGVGLLGVTHGSPPLAVLGFAGALLHVLNHAIFKGLLFLGAGAVLHATGTRDLDHLGGLERQMPVTSRTFLTGAVAISGLPPLNGFVSELLILLAAVAGVSERAAGAAVPATLVMASLGLIGGLAAACFAKAYGVVFLGAPRRPQPVVARDPGPGMRNVMVVLAALCFAIGLGGFVLVPRLAPAVQQLTRLTGEELVAVLGWDLGRILLAVGLVGAVFLLVVLVLARLRAGLLAGREVGSSPTWDCGYAAPSARMQYTASSFARPIVEIFAPVLCTRADEVRPAGAFPTAARLSTETPDVAATYAFRPVFAGLARVAERLHALQQGRVQVYVAYIALALLVLLVWQLGLGR